MKKHFIADFLTFAKIVPAIWIFFGVYFGYDSASILVLFAIGEFLDALDGVAAKKWPHPPETDKLWFRKNLKLIESGLDLLLGIAALMFIIRWVNPGLGLILLIVAMLFGIYTEIILYGKPFGTPETAEPEAMFRKNPKKARVIVGGRLIMYTYMIVRVILLLIFSSSAWTIEQKGEIVVLVFVILALIILSKRKQGRLDDVRDFFRYIWHKFD